jgi:hypothetical protein
MNSRATQIASIAGVIVLAAVVIIVILVSSSGGSKSPSPTQAAAPSSSATGTTAATPAAVPGASGTPAAAAPPLGQRTKTDGCTINGALPDPACTPGAIFPNVTKEQICKPGYAKSVRNVPDSEKNQVYAEYGIKHHKAGEYEVDHLVSLELGGSNEIANLWPEAASPTPGFHQKDRYENYLHDQVCSGAISLEEAQRRIATNWLQYWQEAGEL